MNRLEFQAGVYFGFAGLRRAQAGYYQTYAVYKTMKVNYQVKKPNSTATAR